MQLNAAPGETLVQQMREGRRLTKFHSQLLWRAKVSAKFGRSGALSGEMIFGFYAFAVVGKKASVMA
jgi:hypothetical protein